MNKMLLEKKKEEALSRMELIKLPSELIEDFKENGRVYCSGDLIYGSICQLNNATMAQIHKLEDEYGLLVYYSIIDNCYDYTMLSLLYVSAVESDWEDDRLMLENNQTIAYVHNLSVPEFSEFGTILMDNRDGILIRTV